MTIKEFSKLCGCNPQTLRYYDHQDLLKPIKVDEWSGYRYYDENQARVFVKIKNLQRAGFTINEVKALLEKEDADIYHAFDLKIAEEEQKIKEIKEIQMTYQIEVINMEKKIEMLRALLCEARDSYIPDEEFGISGDEYTAVLEMLDTMLDQIKKRGDYSRFEFNDYAEDDPGTEESYFEGILYSPNYEVIFERHGWEFAKDFFDEMPKLQEHKQYMLLFKLNAAKTNQTAFANTVIGMCCTRAGIPLNIGCTVTDTQDEINHFWLLIYKGAV